MLRHRKKGGGSVCFRKRRGEPGLSLRGNERADVSPPIQAGGVWRLANPSESMPRFAGDQRRDGTSMATPYAVTEHPLMARSWGEMSSPGHLCSHGPAGCQPPLPARYHFAAPDAARDTYGDPLPQQWVLHVQHRILDTRILRSLLTQRRCRKLSGPTLNSMWCRPDRPRGVLGAEALAIRGMEVTPGCSRLCDRLSRVRCGYGSRRPLI